MSLRYKGATISATAPVTTGGESGTAPGAWTLEQQSQLQAAGLWPLPPQPKYIEDVFSTYLYTGNGSTQTITNGIDLAGKGGLVWTKGRWAIGSMLIDTVRGGNYRLSSDATDGQYTSSELIKSFNSSGYSIGNFAGLNYSAEPYNSYASWTFRKQPKFFDVVTWTGNGTVRTIPHSLGSVPGCIIVKETSAVRDWYVYHTSIGNPNFLNLNTTAAAGFSNSVWNATDPTSTNFTVGTSIAVNDTGQTYVAYLFANNAGGFGPAFTDNVISCGSFTGNGSSTVSINLGYEPQWVMFKSTDASAGNSQWLMFDNMRGFPTFGQGASYLKANSSDAEGTNWPYVGVNSTGFQVANDVAATGNFIYIAIRRGPMKVPTDGTKVFAAEFQGQTSTNYAGYLGQPTDFWLRNTRSGNNHFTRTRLLGGNYTTTNTNSAESVFSLNWWDNHSGVGVSGTTYPYDNDLIQYLFRRAPGFFDTVCYTGTGSNPGVFNHNLTAVPEMIIVKSRSAVGNWWSYHSALGKDKYIVLNTDSLAPTNANTWGTSGPALSQFTVNIGATNTAGVNYVAYLFATCPGVSKVGSYTGTGASQVINCGFTAGARFVLIKRTDSTGGWYTYDTARGMVTGTDPYLLLNSTAAEVNANSIYTATTGFQIVSTAAGINASGGSYIFLAIA